MPVKSAPDMSTFPSTWITPGSERNSLDMYASEVATIEAFAAHTESTAALGISLQDSESSPFMCNRTQTLNLNDAPAEDHVHMPAPTAKEYLDDILSRTTPELG